MRLLFLTDTHLRASNPVGRKDDFLQAILKKVGYALAWGNTNGVDAVLHGGDLTDSWNVTHSVGEKLAALIRLHRIPWYICPGQHDMLNADRASYDQTMMGLLASALGEDLFQVLPNAWEGGIATIGTVKVAAYHYRFGGEQEIVKKMVDLAGSMDIQMIHQMVVESPKPAGFNHVLVQNLPRFARLTLMGDYHPGVALYAEHWWFINPGAVARLSRTKSDMIRQPLALTIDTDSWKVEALPLPYEQDVWVSEEEALQIGVADMDEFKKVLGSISSEDLDSMNPRMMVEAVGKKTGAAPHIVEAAVRALSTEG